jgi:hypothetical protein
MTKSALKKSWKAMKPRDTRRLSMKGWYTGVISVTTKLLGKII